MRLETRAQRAFWAICALLTALFLASPGATQAPDDSDTSSADAPVDGEDDNAEDSDAEGEEDDSADRKAGAGAVDEEPARGAALDPDIENIIVDCHDIDFLRSTALGFFVALSKKTTKNGGQMVFCNVSSKAAKIFRATKLDQIWKICGSRAEAIEEVEK